MPKFTNKLSGSVVNVDDATAENLGPEWVPFGEPVDDISAPRRGRPRKTN